MKHLDCHVEIVHMRFTATNVTARVTSVIGGGIQSQSWWYLGHWYYKHRKQISWVKISWNEDWKITTLALGDCFYLWAAHSSTLKEAGIEMVSMILSSFAILWSHEFNLRLERIRTSIPLVFPDGGKRRCFTGWKCMNMSCRSILVLVSP